MHRISNGTQVGALPTPAAVVGTPGYATGGVPGVLAATDIDPDQWNSFQEELCAVVSAAGITLSKTSNSQVLQALTSLFAAKLVQRKATWLDPVADFGCAFDGVTDDTVNFQAFLNGMVTQKLPGRMPPGTAKITGTQLVLDLALVARSGIILEGCGPAATTIDVTACTGSPQFQIECTATGGAAFYSVFHNFQVLGTSSGVTFQLGRDATAPDVYPDAMNSFDLQNIIVKNTGTGGTAVKYGYVIDSDLDVVANGPGSGSGVAIQCDQVVSCILRGAVGNAAIGYWFVNGYSYSNSIIAVDHEVLGCIAKSDSTMAHSNTWIGGQMNWTGASAFVLNAAGGPFYVVLANFGSGPPTVSGAAASNMKIFDSGVGGLTMGTIDIAPTGGDSAVNIHALPGQSAWTVSKALNVSQWLVGMDTGGGWGVHRYVAGVAADIPLFIDNPTGTVGVTTLNVSTKAGFFGQAPVAQQTVTGSRGSATTAVLASLLTALAATGLIHDGTTA
jgi:hypothetical protein